jgi:hypothetical protein
MSNYHSNTQTGIYSFMISRTFILCTIIFCFGFVACGDKGDVTNPPGGDPPPGGGPPPSEIIVTQGSTLVQKLAWVRTNVQSNTNYIIKVSANETVPAQSLSYSGKTGVGVSISSDTGGEYIITASSNTLFTISGGVTLTLGNITLQGRTANNALVLVNSGGTLEMKPGAKITGHTNNLTGVSSYGSGVYVKVIFIMNGGEISGNTSVDAFGVVYVDGGTFTMNDGEISGNNDSGVYVHHKGTFTMIGGKISENTSMYYGGGVHVLDGTFTMSGGEISDNTMTNGGGGGVFVSPESLDWKASFIMSGGKISGNTADKGGGVHTDGTFTMSGGVISGNKVTGSGSGGGVHTDGTFTMSGGTISGNEAYDGGGVAVSSGGTFIMNDGTISGNTASNNGGGVYIMFGGTFYMSNGTIYGSSEADSIKNTAFSQAALYMASATTAQHGTFINDDWTSKGNLSASDDTITVLNGELQQ